MKEIPDVPFYCLSKLQNEFLESYSIFKKLSIESDETLKEFLSKENEKEYMNLKHNFGNQIDALLTDNPYLTYKIGFVDFLNPKLIGKNPLAVQALWCLYEIVDGKLMYYCGGHPERMNQFRSLLATVVEIIDNYILPYVESESVPVAPTEVPPWYKE